MSDHKQAKMYNMKELWPVFISHSIFFKFGGVSDWKVLRLHILVLVHVLHNILFIWSLLDIFFAKTIDMKK